MYKQQVYINRTNTYHAGYRHLNEQEYVGEFKMLGGRYLSRNDDGGYVYAFTAVGPKGVNKLKAARGLLDELTTTCRHEHDCCGCTSTYPTVVLNKKRGNFYVMVRGRVNN